MTSILTLPIKKKWYDMIWSGEKTEEYREIKPYYITRFCKKLKDEGYDDNSIIMFTKKTSGLKFIQVRFRNGYGKNSPSFVASCALSIGAGKEEWGAEKGKEYFILKIKEVLD